MPIHFIQKLVFFNCLVQVFFYLKYLQNQENLDNQYFFIYFRFGFIWTVVIWSNDVSIN